MGHVKRTEEAQPVIQGQGGLRGGERDRAKLREALTGTTGFRGVIGVISCDEFGDCGTGRVQITHHTDSSVTDIAGLPVVYSFAP